MKNEKNFFFFFVPRVVVGWTGKCEKRENSLSIPILTILIRGDWRSFVVSEISTLFDSNKWVISAEITRYHRYHVRSEIKKSNISRFRFYTFPFPHSTVILCMEIYFSFIQHRKNMSEFSAMESDELQQQPSKWERKMKMFSSNLQSNRASEWRRKITKIPRCRFSAGDVHALPSLCCSFSAKHKTPFPTHSEPEDKIVSILRR